MICITIVVVFAATKILEKKVSEGEELKKQLDAELREKIKKMEKELENSTVKAAGKHCCKNTDILYLTFHTQVDVCLLEIGIVSVVLQCVKSVCTDQLPRSWIDIYLFVLCSRCALSD